MSVYNFFRHVTQPVEETVTYTSTPNPEDINAVIEATIRTLVKDFSFPYVNIKSPVFRSSYAGQVHTISHSCQMRFCQPVRPDSYTPMNKFIIRWPNNEITL
jgi:hypothetical protein